MNRSPGTRRTASSVCQRTAADDPQHAGQADGGAQQLPLACGCTPKNSVPTASIHTGMLQATSVTLIGVLVTSARYCSELNRPTPSSPTSAR